jgi:hypothetical protein
MEKNDTGYQAAVRAYCAEVGQAVPSRIKPSVWLRAIEPTAAPSILDETWQFV